MVTVDRAAHDTVHQLGRRHGRPRETAVAVLLDPLQDEQAVIVQCQCRTKETAELRAEWLRARLAERRGRAVYTAGS